MKKSTWRLLGLLIGQPVLVYLGQSALLPVIPSHYGWLGAVAYTSDPHHYFAMLESAFIPAVLLAIMPLNKRLPPLLWLTIFRTNFSWWLFGLVKLGNHNLDIRWLDGIPVQVIRPDCCELSLSSF